MKMKFKFLLPLIIMLVVIIGSSNTAFAQPCDTCNSVWSSASTTTYTFTLPSTGCNYKVYIKYRTRVCNGYTQLDMISHVIEDLNPPGSCILHCIHTRELRKIMYNHLLNLLGTGATVVVAEPSPCYYLGWIEVPPGADLCFGFTPGNKLYVTMPCDENGCCYKELTPVGTTTYYQTVINSTPCPPMPFTPPSTTIEWACDIVGGGFATFNVVFHPDTPIVCQLTCIDGYAKTTGVQNVNEESTLTNLKAFPNPMDDKLQVSFFATTSDDVTVDIFDVTGKVVFHKIYAISIGAQELTIDTRSVANGVYSLKIDNGGVVQTLKVVK